MLMGVSVAPVKCSVHGTKERLPFSDPQRTSLQCKIAFNRLSSPLWVMKMAPYQTHGLCLWDRAYSRIWRIIAIAGPLSSASGCVRCKDGPPVLHPHQRLCITFGRAIFLRRPGTGPPVFASHLHRRLLSLRQLSSSESRGSAGTGTASLYIAFTSALWLRWRRCLPSGARRAQDRDHRSFASTLSGPGPLAFRDYSLS
jgi:hypothetical protein